MTLSKCKSTYTSHKIWYIALYIRLSRNDTGKESESVRNQKDILTEAVAEMFAGEDYVIVDYYIDDGRTGTDDDNREDFVRMKEDIKSKKINTVICKSLSRAFRNHSDQGFYLEDFFPRYNIRFISIANMLDTYKDPEKIYGFEIPISGISNDRFAYNTSVEIRRSFLKKKKHGDFISAFAPYGYLKDPKNKNRFILDQNVKENIINIFKWYVYDGMSINKIVHKLNDLGILNPTAYKKSIGLKYYNPNSNQNNGLWSAKSIREMLLNQSYLGHMVQGKQRNINYKVHQSVKIDKEDWIIVENTHEPIIDKKIFDLAQKKLSRNSKSSQKTMETHLFAGHLFCYDCGKAMHKKKSGKYDYYYCYTHTGQSKGKCTKHTIRADTLYDIVLKFLQNEIKKLDNIEHILKKIKKNPSKNINTNYIDDNIKKVKNSIKKSNEILDSLYLDFKNEILSKDQYLRLKKKLENDIYSYQNNINNLNEEKANIKNVDKVTDDIFKSFYKLKNINELDKMIILTTIDKILIKEDKSVIIETEYKNQLNSALQFIENNK